MIDIALVLFYTRYGVMPCLWAIVSTGCTAAAHRHVVHPCPKRVC
jgi:hypothetical protein